MKRNFIKKITYLVASLMMLTLVWACGGEANGQLDENEYHLYYLNDSTTTIKTQVYTASSETKEELVKELLLKLSDVPEDKRLVPLFDEKLKINSYNINEDQVTVDFTSSYYEMPVTKEILVRAGVVRTLSQIEGVNFVIFKVEGENLTDAKGEPIGMMVKEMFIDNEGSQISDIVDEDVVIYYANATGDKLVPVSLTLSHNSSIPIEKLVLESLIAGPKTGEGQPTINPSTKVLNVTTKEGICYVNLDESFLTSIYPVTNEVVIYSIVDTLTNINNVNKVQLMVNGESKVSLRESISLENGFTREFDIIESPEVINEDTQN